MPTKPSTRPSLDDQLEEFNLQFELQKQYEAEIETLDLSGRPAASNQAAWNDWWHKRQDVDSKYRRLGKTNRWHWDEAWDGMLVRNLKELEAEGFSIVEFTRALKIRLAGYAGMKQPEILQRIWKVTGDVANVKFTKGGIWIQLPRPKTPKKTT